MVSCPTIVVLSHVMSHNSDGNDDGGGVRVCGDARASVLVVMCGQGCPPRDYAPALSTEQPVAWPSPDPSRGGGGGGDDDDVATM